MSRGASSSETLRGAAAVDGFNFNSNQPLPWHVRKDERSIKLPQEEQVQVRMFSKCHDAELRKYLHGRNISIGFLYEIDQFFDGHPEIATYSLGKELIREINSLSPLNAYLLFVKGYTRPARYNEGIDVSSAFKVPVGFRPAPLRSKFDPELVDFFEGFQYRGDIVDQIDREVVYACMELSSGRPVPSGLRRLFYYAVWGNPIDAYKWYEYNYQEVNLEHRYLPEHVILCDAPKSRGYTLPNPSVFGTSRKHANIRYRMARANDEGIDVIDVLLSEYKTALMKRGLRRGAIDGYCERAKNRLNAERQRPTGVDIIDLIMDDLPGRSTARPNAYKPEGYPVWPSNARSMRHHVVWNMATCSSRNVRIQVAELITARRNLLQLYALEKDSVSLAPTCNKQERSAVSTRRGRAERRYVSALIRYMRDSGQMTRAEAGGMQRRFTRKRMDGMGPVNKHILLGMFPRELQ